EGAIVPRVRYRHDDIGIDRKFSCQFASHFHAHFSNVNAADHAIRPREINVFEHAERGPRVREWSFRAHSVFIIDQHFAGFNLADELRMNQIKNARLGSQNIGVLRFAEGQWAPAKWIAHADQFAFTHDDE